LPAKKELPAIFSVPANLSKADVKAQQVLFQN
jgi:hypothetical protein